LAQSRAEEKSGKKHFRNFKILPGRILKLTAGAPPKTHLQEKKAGEGGGESYKKIFPSSFSLFSSNRGKKGVKMRTG
jgi:hypothetical protein